MRKSILAAGLVMSQFLAVAPSYAAGELGASVLAFSTSASTVAVNSSENRLVVRAHFVDTVGVTLVKMSCDALVVSIVWPLDKASASMQASIDGNPLSLKAPTAPITGDPRDFNIVAGFDPSWKSYPFSCQWSVEMVNRQGVKSLTETGVSLTLTAATKPEATTWPLVKKPKYTPKQLNSLSLKRYKNCAAVYRYFEYGIAISEEKAWDAAILMAEPPYVSRRGYQLNRTLDRDRDGVICER